MELLTKLVKTLASPMGEARADSDSVNGSINCDLSFKFPFVELLSNTHTLLALPLGEPRDSADLKIER